LEEAVKLSGILRESPVFLIAGGPSLRTLDLSLLNSPGCYTLGLNNSVKSYRPNLWISVDDPGQFLFSIWQDPKILKFVREEHRDSFLFDSEIWTLTNQTPADCPNVIFYRSNLQFRAETFLHEDSANWGNEDPPRARSVLLAALKNLYHLGAGHVFLLGVDFEMDQDSPYHFAEFRSPAGVAGNHKSYEILQTRFAKLNPLFEQHGFYVWNCNPSSKLTAFPFVSFEESLAFATAAFKTVETEPSQGLYERRPNQNGSAEVFASGVDPLTSSQVRRVDRSKRPYIQAAESLASPVGDLSKRDGVLLLADAKQEWLLPWWWYHFVKSNPRLAVAVVDLGITPSMQSWLSQQGAALVQYDSDLPHFSQAWFSKPFALALSPFDRTIFCDLDCEVRRDLSAMFGWSEAGIVLGQDLFPDSQYRKLFRQGCYYNSGLISVGHTNPIIEHWCEETRNLHTSLRSDQEILNLCLYEAESLVVELPPHYHQLRLSGDHADATVMHWTGGHGKTNIRREMERLFLQ